MLIYTCDDFTSTTKRIIYSSTAGATLFLPWGILNDYIAGDSPIFEVFFILFLVSMTFFSLYLMSPMVYMGGRNLKLQDAFIEFEMANDFLGLSWKTIRLNQNDINFLNIRKTIQFSLIGEIHLKNKEVIKVCFYGAHKVIDRSHPFIDIPFLRNLSTAGGIISSLFKTFDATPLMFYVIADHLGLKITGKKLHEMHNKFGSTKVDPSLL